MSGILNLLSSPMGKQLVNGVANHTGQPENKTAEVLSMAMPLLLGGMKKNASSPQGAAGLLSALSDNKHDGSMLNNLGGLFSGGVDQSVLKDGEGILDHVFGGKKTVVENTLSQKSGLNTEAVAQILKIAAPLVMAYLGQQKKQGDVKDAGGLNTLLGSMLGGQPDQNKSLITTLLDADGDGSVLDDVAGMVLGGDKKKGGIGGMLGGLFGK